MPRDAAVVITAATLRRAVLIGLAILLLVGTGFIVYTQRDRIPALSEGVVAYVDRDAYQAVFLTSGQVYFGRLRLGNAEVYLLSDIYYLNTPPQEGQQGQLLKRGGELHGPRDPMIIPSGQVLFVENVRDDSEVMTAIRRFQRGETPATTAIPQPSPTR